MNNPPPNLAGFSPETIEMMRQRGLLPPAPTPAAPPPPAPPQVCGPQTHPLGSFASLGRAFAAGGAPAGAGPSIDFTDPSLDPSVVGPANASAARAAPPPAPAGAAPPAASPGAPADESAKALKPDQLQFH